MISAAASLSVLTWVIFCTSGQFFPIRSVVVVAIIMPPKKVGAGGGRGLPLLTFMSAHNV